MLLDNSFLYLGEGRQEEKRMEVGRKEEYWGAVGGKEDYWVAAGAGRLPQAKLVISILPQQPGKAGAPPFHREATHYSLLPHPLLPLPHPTQWATDIQNVNMLTLAVF